MTVQAFACVLLVGHATDTRLQVWQLELFPQPVDDVIDGQFQHELHATWLRGSLALVLAAGLVVGSAQHVARGRAPLPGGDVGLGRAQPEAVVFEQLHRYPHGTMAAAQDLCVGDDFRQPLADRFSDLLAMAKPVAGTA